MGTNVMDDLDCIAHSAYRNKPECRAARLPGGDLWIPIILFVPGQSAKVVKEVVVDVTHGAEFVGSGANCTVVQPE